MAGDLYTFTFIATVDQNPRRSDPVEVERIGQITRRALEKLDRRMITGDLEAVYQFHESRIWMAARAKAIRTMHEQVALLDDDDF